MNIVQAIRGYHDNSVGCAWDIFWNYKCKIEEGRDSIFSDRHISMTSLHLFVYLTCFGMARATTHLTEITVHDFSKILGELSNSYNAVKDIRFETLTGSDRDPVVSLRTRPEGKHEIPPSRLIDMAFWYMGKMGRW